MRPSFGMDRIRRPVLRRNVFNTLIDCFLQGNETGVKVGSNAVNGINIAAEMREHGVIRIVAKHKRLAYHNLAVTFCFYLDEKLFVSPFIFIQRDSVRQFFLACKLSPDIVDPDHDAEDIGVVVETILLPAGFEVADCVAGDSGVEDVKIVCRVFAEEEIGDVIDIAEAEGLMGAVISVGVCDAVADEDNCVIWFQINFV